MADSSGFRNFKFSIVLWRCFRLVYVCLRASVSLLKTSTKSSFSVTVKRHCVLSKEMNEKARKWIMLLNE